MGKNATSLETEGFLRVGMVFARRSPPHSKNNAKVVLRNK
jgi:hypothetical protein